MSADLLTVGVELPDYRASARMPADPVENKIHEDGLAKAMGFRGGLVPGVIVRKSVDTTTARNAMCSNASGMSNTAIASARTTMLTATAATAASAVRRSRSGKGA